MNHLLPVLIVLALSAGGVYCEHRIRRNRLAARIVARLMEAAV